jgi:hypothetical protein
MSANSPTIGFCPSFAQAAEDTLDDPCHAEGSITDGLSVSNEKLRFGSWRTQARPVLTQRRRGAKTQSQIKMVSQENPAQKTK